MPECTTGLLGHNIGYSVSPMFHRAFFRLLDRPGDYCLFDRPENEIASVMEMVRQGVIRGLNITIPYKVRVAGLCDQLSDSASRIRAVNVVYARDGQLIGHNTDAPGFSMAVKHHGIQGKSALILGAGGAARAVILALLRDGWSDIFVRGRTVEHVEKLYDLFPQLRLGDPPDPVDLIVNATPVRDHDFMALVPGPARRWLKDTGAFFDLNYNPPLTAGMEWAKAIGARAVCGIVMLVFQAALSWESWFDVNPLEVIDFSQIL